MNNSYAVRCGLSILGCVGEAPSLALERVQEGIGHALCDLFPVQASVGAIPHAHPVMRAEHRLGKNASIHGSELTLANALLDDTTIAALEFIAAAQEGIAPLTIFIEIQNRVDLEHHRGADGYIFG